MRSHRSVVVAALVCALFATRESRAFGPVAHAVIARVAYTCLEPNVRARFDTLAQGEELGSLSSWADEIREARPDSAPLHYVNIPRQAEHYWPSRDCARAGCVVEALENYARELEPRRSASPAASEALRFIVHLVGDVHQPLHCSDDGDRGGNSVELIFFARPTNLHRVWDSELLAHAQRGERALERRVASLARGLAPGPLDFAAWAEQSHALARAYAYALPRGKPGIVRKLGAKYLERNAPIAERQLALAAVRLAALLNEKLRR